MLSTARIRELFGALNDALRKLDVIGEVGICGGAVMCLVFDARPSTKDVDAVFEPAAAIREAALQVAQEFNVPEDWLNDAAKGFFFSDPPRQMVLELPNLRVWAPTAKYLLAMKCISARFDSHDLDDVKFLLQHLQIESVAKVHEIISSYCPKGAIPAKTQFMLEELFSL